MKLNFQESEIIEFKTSFQEEVMISLVAFTNYLEGQFIWVLKMMDRDKVLSMEKKPFKNG